MSSIVVSDLSFGFPDGRVLFQHLTFSIPPGRTGLTAANGAGKSTLLRLIAGLETPSTGAVTVDGTIGYLPQTLPFEVATTVGDLLGVTPVRAALDALAAGDASDAVFAAIGDDWDVENRVRAQLGALGMSDVPWDRRLDAFSGGEVVTLGLAAQLLRRPDALLLDEPTNNLDSVARQGLYESLDVFAGTLLVVSHDRALLDRVDRMAELHRGDMVFFGGTFSEYEAAVDAAQRAAEDEVRNAGQQLRREKRRMQEARERAARRSGTATRRFADGGMPKIIAGGLKRKAQESAARADDVHSRRVGTARERLDDAERLLRDDDRLVLDLPDTAVPAGRTVIAARGVRVTIDGRDLFGHNGIDVDVVGPQRIAVTGRNGAGKSTLLRVLAGELVPARGEVMRADGRVAHLSQRLDLLDERRSVMENVVAFAPSLSDTRRMHLLAQFLFRGDRVHLPVSALSGGERLRATLACVLFAEPAPQLLLLDEPTNNLDLSSVAQLESALRSYRGALIVVSHDERFLEAVGVERWMALGVGAGQP